MKETYTAEELAALFKEIREDEAAAKREDAHMVSWGMEAFQKFLDTKKKAPSAEKVEERDKGIDR